MNISVANRLSLYYSYPIVISCICTLAVFNLPDSFLHQVIIFGAVPVLLMLACRLVGLHKFPISSALAKLQPSSGQRLIIYLFSGVVIAAAPLDIYVNGFKLADPQSYAELNGYGRFVRHVTIHAWMLIPVAFYAVRPDFKLLKSFLILFAIIVPILTIDRNRLFLGFYCFIFCFLATRQRDISYKKILLMLLLMLTVFIMIGTHRSGDSFVVPSSGSEIEEGLYPFKDYFPEIPVGMQQVLLYITTPIFNLATVADSGFETSSYLINQLSPFSREDVAASEVPQLVVPRFNVGTEFFPFLLYGGWPPVILAMLGILLSLILSAYIFVKTRDFIVFIVFLKFSYSSLFMGFAPQFYLFLNLAFLLLMLIMGAVGYLLTYAMSPEPCEEL